MVSIQEKAPGLLLAIPNGIVLFVREVCLLESAAALDSSSSSISPNHRFINIPLPLLLGHPGLEVVCARAQHGNVFPGSALPVGSFLSGKLPTGHRCLEGFREILGALSGVPCTVYGMLEV